MATVSEVEALAKSNNGELIPHQSDKMKAKGIIMFGFDKPRYGEDFANEVQSKLALNSWVRESDGSHRVLAFVTKTPLDTSLVF